MRTVWPGIEPSSRKPASNASRDGTALGAVRGPGISTPIVGTRAGACAWPGAGATSASTSPSARATHAASDALDDVQPPRPVDEVHQAAVQRFHVGDVGGGAADHYLAAPGAVEVADLSDAAHGFTGG